MGGWFGYTHLLGCYIWQPCTSIPGKTRHTKWTSAENMEEIGKHLTWGPGRCSKNLHTIWIGLGAGTWLRHGGCMSHWRYCRLRQTVFPETVCNWYGDTPHVTTVSFTVSIHPSHTDTHCVTLNTQGTRGSHRSPSSPMVYPTSSPKETCMPINSPSISA